MPKIIPALIACAAALAFVAVPASAGHDENPSPKVTTYTYDVEPIPHPLLEDRDVSGTVRISELPNQKLQVKVRISGVTPNAPHAQHLHGVLSDDNDDDNPHGNNFCPGPEFADDEPPKDFEDLISTLEAVPAYGPIQVSLTTRGDVSRSSALAVERFPVADESGDLRYTRTIDLNDLPEDLSGDILANLGDLHYVVHGIDIDGDGSYDFDPYGESPLTISGTGDDPSGPDGPDDFALPYEATIPSGCAGTSTTP